MYATIAARLDYVRERIAQAEARFGRMPGSVRLVAVSKTVTMEDILRARLAGQTRFAENYVQEALPKITGSRLAGQGLEWHFIGPLQANKTQGVATHFDWVHSVDRPRIAQRLSDQRPAHLAPLQVCLQVKLDVEPGKSGVSLEELPELVATVAALPQLHLRGLMIIPAPCNDEERQRLPFRRLHEVFQQLQAQGYSLDTLSMGMSADLEPAIAEGATLVRIGTAIFGMR